MVIFEKDLPVLFQNKITQLYNDNSNSDLFIYEDKVLKIYKDDCKKNIEIIESVLNHYNELANIKSLVLPDELIIYNNHIVGFSMPYIKGNTLDEIIINNTFNEQQMCMIFRKILEVISSFKKLSFSFSIGDLHEKNIIIDNNLNVYIIDCDSFIINNNKMTDNNDYLVGKYPNHCFDNNTLSNDVLFDYHTLLCIIFNYIFQDIIINKDNPIEIIKNDSQFKDLKYLCVRAQNIESFELTTEDINDIFEFKKRLIYHKPDNTKYIKEIERVHKLIKQL